MPVVSSTHEGEGRSRSTNDAERRGAAESQGMMHLQRPGTLQSHVSKECTDREQCQTARGEPWALEKTARKSRFNGQIRHKAQILEVIKKTVHMRYEGRGRARRDHGRGWQRCFGKVEWRMAKTDTLEGISAADGLLQGKRSRVFG